jgi:hypothetical protein
MIYFKSKFGKTSPPKKSTNCKLPNIPLGIRVHLTLALTKRDVEIVRKIFYRHPMI